MRRGAPRGRGTLGVKGGSACAPLPRTGPQGSGGPVGLGLGEGTACHSCSLGCPAWQGESGFTPSLRSANGRPQQKKTGRLQLGSVAAAAAVVGVMSPHVASNVRRPCERPTSKVPSRLSQHGGLSQAIWPRQDVPREGQPQCLLTLSPSRMNPLFWEAICPHGMWRPMRGLGTSWWATLDRQRIGQVGEGWGSRPQGMEKARGYQGYPSFLGPSPRTW